MEIPAARLSLETAAAAIVRRLGGAWRPGGAMCRCPTHDDHTPSLSVRVGNRSLLFKCFAGCDAHEIMRAIRQLKLDIPADADPCRSDSAGTGRSSAALAAAIWSAARPVVGTRAAGYLAVREITCLSDMLRYHPRTPLGRGASVRFRPAIVAAVRDSSRLTAIQRLFLDPDRPALARDLPKPKLTLGRPLAGAVRLFRPTDCLGLAEGIETAQSAAILLGIPVWATLGNERLARVAIPDSVDRLVLLPDNDTGGHLAERQARDAFARPGRTITTLWPWRGLNDWNDVLIAERALVTAAHEPVA